MIGTNVTFTCETSNTAQFRWRKDDTNITTDDKRYLLTIDESRLPDVRYNLTVRNVTASDTGIFTCEQHGPIDGDEKAIRQRFALTAVTLPRIHAASLPSIHVNSSGSVSLFCVIEAHPMADFNKTIKWTKKNGATKKPVLHNQHAPEDVLSSIEKETSIIPLTESRVNVTLTFSHIKQSMNGTYSCTMHIPSGYPKDPVFDGFHTVLSTSSVFVLHEPQISLDYVKAIGANQIFMNWTVNDGNSPVTQYFVQFKEGDATSFAYYHHLIGGKNTSFVLQNFKPNTTYVLRISAKNKIGTSNQYEHPNKIHTLGFDPVFVPTIEVKGSSHSSISLSCNAPPANIQEFIHYFEMMVTLKNDTNGFIEKIYPQYGRNLPNMITNVSCWTRA